MTFSDTTDSHLARIALALSGCQSHAADLPADANPAIADLQQHHDTIVSLTAEQDRIQQELDRLRDRIGIELLQAARARAEVLRIAERHYGAMDPRLKAFRPASEARLHAPRISQGAQSA